MPITPIIKQLLAFGTAPRQASTSLDAWLEHCQAAWLTQTDSAARALLAGVIADRLGFAFAGGYCAALQRLLNDPTPRLGALCVTEAGGNQPKHIETSLAAEGAAWRLNGEKTFVTLGDRAEMLWVAASTGEAGGRKQIKMVGIPANLQGVHLTLLPTLAFVPEIGHACVRFDNVTISADALLPGDGYSDYVKPFRTIEDIHVAAATCGLLLGQALRHAWPQAAILSLLSLADHWLHLAQAPADAPSTHLVLAGLMAQQQQLIESVTPHISADGNFAYLWQRDLPLLKVAGKARHQRTANAWQLLMETPTA